MTGPKCGGPGGQTEAAAEQGKGDAAEYADADHGPQLTEEDALRKRAATLAARLALRGFEMRQTADGWMVSRWDLARHATDLDGVEAFARQVGA